MHERMTPPTSASTGHAKQDMRTVATQEEPRVPPVLMPTTAPVTRQELPVFLLLDAPGCHQHCPVAFVVLFFEAKKEKVTWCDRTWEFQESVCHNTGCCARQQGTPTQMPSLLRASTQEQPFTTGTSACQSARTTRRDLARRPTNSGYLRSFRRSAMEIATPSLWAAPLLRCHRSGGRSPVSCPPPAGPLPTVATRPLPLRVGVHRLRWVRGGPGHATARLCSAATSLSADTGHHTLQSKPPPPCAGSAVMATPASTHGQREGELKTQQEEAEMVGTQSRGESQTTPRPSLGS